MTRDFPYYHGDPVGIGPRRWSSMLLSMVAGYLALLLLPATSPGWQLLARWLFVACPVAALSWATQGRASALRASVAWSGLRTLVVYDESEAGIVQRIEEFGMHSHLPAPLVGDAFEHKVAKLLSHS